MGRRLLVYIDVPYRYDGRVYTTDRAFMKLIVAIAPYFEEVVLVGRVRPGASDYPIPPQIRVVALPDYPTLRSVRAVLGAAPRALSVLWRAVGGADEVLSIGPHPLSLPTAVFARLRRKPLTLMVRQNYPEYIRHRLPSRRWKPFVAIAAFSDALFRTLARSSAVGVVVVGDELAQRYASSKRLLNLPVSLMPESAHGTRGGVEHAESNGSVRLLSVTRLDPEKDPLLLLDAVALVGERRPTWRVSITIVGEGPLRDRLERRAAELGIEATFLGYVAHGEPLFELFRTHDVLVHTAKTEGMPQVLVEALSIGLPIVATDVGGVRGLVAGGAAAALVPPSDSGKLADAVIDTMTDADVRDSRVAEGLEVTAGLTLESQAASLAEFVRGARLA